MARKKSVDLTKTLKDNVARLNEILAGGVAYLSFGFQEMGFASQCFGSKRIHGESENWHAYTVNGSMHLDKPKTGWLSLRDMPERELEARHADFYLPEARHGVVVPNSSYITLALSGGHVHNKLWHMFYFADNFSRPVFDYHMSRDERVDYVALNASLIVLPGKKNIERFFEVREKIIRDAPEFIIKDEWSQESERDKGHQVKTKVQNPYKNSPRPLDMFSAFGWPPEVKKLEDFFHHHLPRLPERAEFEQSISKIAEASQLALPFAAVT